MIHLDELYDLYEPDNVMKFASRSPGFDENVTTYVDLPCSFNSSGPTVTIFGLEPRYGGSKDDRFIVERHSTHLFYGSVFGASVWNKNNLYYKAFKELIDFTRLYMLDTVKHYFFTGNIKKDHDHARDTYKANSQLYLPWVKQELELIKPDVVVALGREVERFFKNNSIFCEYIRHPANGGLGDTQKKLRSLLTKWRKNN